MRLSHVIGRLQIKTVQKKAADLLESWAPLQEYFKIPKKERHKLRVEHEREADRHFRNVLFI